MTIRVTWLESDPDEGQPRHRAQVDSYATPEALWKALDAQLKTIARPCIVDYSTDAELLEGLRLMGALQERAVQRAMMIIGKGQMFWQATATTLHPVLTGHRTYQQGGATVSTNAPAGGGGRVLYQPTLARAQVQQS